MILRGSRAYIRNRDEVGGRTVWIGLHARSGVLNFRAWSDRLHPKKLQAWIARPPEPPALRLACAERIGAPRPTILNLLWERNVFDANAALVRQLRIYDTGQRN